MEKNISYKLDLIEGLSAENRDILRRYWNFNGTKFPESIGEISKNYDRHYTGLLRMVQESSRAIIQDHCAICQTELEPLAARSQTRFKKYFQKRNFCPPCQKIENERLALEQKEEEQRYYENRDRCLDDAVSGRAWLRLTQEENLFLLRMIEAPYQNINYSEFAHLYPSDNSEVIDKVMYYGLIHEGSPYDMEDLGYHFSPRLPEELRTYLKDLENEPRETFPPFNGFEIASDKHICANPFQISIELKKCKPLPNRETLLNAGTVVIENDIVIKAGTTCVYGVSSLDNENMWLSLTPVFDIIDPQNASIDEQPELLKSILESALTDDRKNSWDT